ncbi:hypothetical protein [Rhizobium lentis]|uniref:Uncharacterized protein n=1 Tax=Rhizobium lentis TaxID=1138194 RepID=A0A7W8UQF5_9HYPH|nr:hypothetical protein [Rhizobium lentis]MBB5551207.1 hypothetical protein [Rhizobium lentis]MBB5561744.1 hypothetical protein [Rhizobium lentis]MBB5568328.1 hypothetical protein [Rhizobium lentis]
MWDLDMSALKRAFGFEAEGAIVKRRLKLLPKVGSAMLPAMALTMFPVAPQGRRRRLSSRFI